MDGLMAVFLILLCLGYFYLCDFRITKKSNYFFAGYMLIILSVASPLHFLGENYLMSAHMASHVLLLLVAAPMLVIGIPADNQHKMLIWISEKFIKFPWISWMTGVCIMWFWHIPVIFNHLFEAPGSPEISRWFSSVVILQNIHLISLVFAGILFSWPIVGPVKSGRFVPVNAVLYLSAACVFCSILGLLITFAPMGIFTHYEHIADRFGFLNRIRNQNGISAEVDQQMAGLIMWVPGCLIYLSASMWLLMKWFKERKEEPVLLTHKRKS